MSWSYGSTEYNSIQSLWYETLGSYCMFVIQSYILNQATIYNPFITHCTIHVFTHQHAPSFYSRLIQNWEGAFYNLIVNLLIQDKVMTILQ